jgi:hypothetical protein
MKLALFQELLNLNHAFQEVMRGLQRMERQRLFQNDMIRLARAEVETARVDTNREFFDKFVDIVEEDASWAYTFQREHKQKTKDLDDVYFDIKDSEERRKKKGLPPRVVILPGWDISDEDRYDEVQTKKKRAARKKASATKRRRTGSARSKRQPQTAVAPASEGEARQ